MTEKLKWDVAGDISEEIKDSIKGQTPSWKNYLSHVAAEHLDKESKEKTHQGAANSIEATEIEKSERKLHLGSDFEQMLSVIAEKSPPPVLESGGVMALLATNEFFDIEEIKKELPIELDGYIFGVGAGNIYSLTHLFDPEKPPRAIMSVDVIPEVVLVGRIAIQLMKRTGNFNEFLRVLQTEEMFLEEAHEVIEKETSQIVKQRLQAVNVKSVLKDIGGQAVHTPTNGIIEYGFHDRVSVFAAIRDRWEVLQKLAREDNIGIGLADMIDGEVVASVSNFGEFRNTANVIYVTNIIDHITDRGTNFGENDKRLRAMGTLQLLDNGKSVFLDTTQGRNYKLRVSQHLPEYSRDDFKITRLF